MFRMGNDKNRPAVMVGRAQSQGKPKTLLMAASAHDLLLPMSHLKTNSFLCKSSPFSDEDENKNAVTANDSFKVSQRIGGIMWDYNSGLLSLSNGISRLPGRSWILFVCALFNGLDRGRPPLSGPTILAKTQTMYLLIPEEKV